MKARDDLFQTVLDWASTQPDIESVILTGSLSRDDGRVDDLSDIDIELIGPAYKRLIADDSWLTSLAPLTTVLKLDPSHDQRWPTRLAIFKSGVKVDFTLADTSRISEMCDSGELDIVFRRGFKVLIDKIGITKNLPDPIDGENLYATPTNEEYQYAVNVFWFEASHIPKYLARGDLWAAKLRDELLKKYCLKMMMWQAAVSSNQSADIWHNGQRMKDWLAADIYNQVDGIFGTFDTASTIAALHAQITLFRRLSLDVAGHMGFDYPQVLDDDISAMIIKMETDHLSD